MGEHPDDLPGDLIEAIDRFHNHCEQVEISPYLDKLNARHVPPVLYHYTDAAGLKGILENGTLWLSDVFNQNDPSELRHGIKHATKLLRDACRAELPEIGLFCDQIEAVLTAKIEQSIHLLICCFSTNWDDLGQWRAYADNGKGFAIGFDAAMLDRCFMADQSGFAASSFHIDYDETSLTALQTKIVEAVLPLISLPRGRNLSEDQQKAYITRLSIYFSNQIICAALFFKHRGYVNEAEFRLLRTYPVTSEIPSVLYRHSGDSLIQYVTLNWNAAGEGMVKEIVVGPAADYERSQRFAVHCLRAYGHLGTVRFRRSDIPYRPLR